MTRTDATPPDVLMQCPECRSHAGRLVPGVSAESYVDYFRCEDCARVWIVEKATGREPRTTPHSQPDGTPERHQSVAAAVPYRALRPGVG